MNVVELLRAARQHITPRSAWTQGRFASTAAGFFTGPFSPNATRWCAVGSMLWATQYCCRDGGCTDPSTCWVIPAGAIGYLMDVACERMPASEGSVSYFNDHPKTTHADVLALFDAAIARAEAAEQAETAAVAALDAAITHATEHLSRELVHA